MRKLDTLPGRLECLKTQISIKAARAGFQDTHVSQFPDTFRVLNCISFPYSNPEGLGKDEEHTNDR